MKKFWVRQIERLDQRSARERLLIFLAGTAVIAGLFWSLAISPAMDHSHTLQVRLADHQGQIAAVTAQLAELHGALQRDPDASVKERIAHLRNELGAIDGQLAGGQRALVAPEAMAALLEELVRQQPGLRVVRLRNLPATPLLESVRDEASATPADEQGEPQQVHKHGVEVVVEGSYLDLLSYVSHLEKQPWQVYWGQTELSSDWPKAQLRLTLYTLSVGKTWLVV